MISADPTLGAYRHRPATARRAHARINGVSTMFLIDKKGVLRSVAARADFEKQIPNLREE